MLIILEVNSKLIDFLFKKVYGLVKLTTTKKKMKTLALELCEKNTMLDILDIYIFIVAKRMTHNHHYIPEKINEEIKND